VTAQTTGRQVKAGTVMKEEKKNKDDVDYKVIFAGATISKKEANKVGVTLIFGSIGIVVIGLLLGLKNKLLIFIIAFILACIGYFGMKRRWCQA
jgi:multidrug efflux pump subunit AcrB